MKNCQYFTRASIIKKYQFIESTAFSAFKYNETEQVYYKEDVQEVHARNRWSMYMRTIKADELPRKIVESRYSKGVQINLYTLE